MALPVLPLLVLAANVTIDNVAAEAASNRITIAVTTSGPVEGADVRSKLADGKLSLYLVGGHVRRDRRAFKSNGLDVAVLKRDDYAKLEIPLAAELGCAGPVSVTATETGFDASVKCRGASVTEETAETQPVAATNRAAKEAPRAEAKPEPKAEAKPEAAVEAKATEAATEKAKTQAETKVETKTETPAAAPAPQKTAPVAAPAPAPARSSGSAMMMPAVVLIGIGAAAFFMKRRQQKKTSMIQILETAQLGPKRQLVVAKVNGETMILGSSEAGITCLSGLHRLPPQAAEWGGSPTQMNMLSQMQFAQMNGHLTGQLPGQIAPTMMVPAAAPAAARSQFPAFEPPAQIKTPNEHIDEGGILTRLFRARGQEKPQEKFDNIELHEFDNLLQESVADQELRQKLSSGLRGKVS